MSGVRKLIIGVDYGTTYSGISYVWSDGTSIKDVAIITSWPTHGQIDSGVRKKVPSRITYDRGGAWGYQVKATDVSYSWTKLLLDKVRLIDFDDENLTNIDPGLLALPEGKTAEDVVTDYLRYLYKYVMDFMERKFSQEILHLTPIDFWFSMPAIWSDRAQLATKRAAEAAGFASRQNDRICMIREPEAAAISCLNELIVDSPSSLIRQGEGVLLCDCGGGTVDISSYEIKRPFPRLQLHETSVSIGGKCGSTTIDRAFNALLKDRFGEAFTKIPHKRKGVGSSLMQAFEEIKKDFGHARETEVYRIPFSMRVPDSEFYERDDEEEDESRGDILLSHADMVSLFKPVVEKIKALIEEQIQKSNTIDIKTVILAGGLGESRYLFHELRSWCSSTITLCNPPGSWEAICRGAALRGLEGPIVPVRKCPRNYGVTIVQAFREGTDDESESYICPFDNVKQSPGYMSWIFEKGEDLTRDTRKNKTFYNITSRAAGERKFPVEFFQSNMAIAPERKAHDSVQSIGELIVDLSDVDFSIFPTRHVPRASTGLAKFLLGTIAVHAIEFEIQNTIIDEDLGVMDFKAIVHGQVRGSVQMKFRVDDNDHISFFK